MNRRGFLGAILAAAAAPAIVRGQSLMRVATIEELPAPDGFKVAEGSKLLVPDSGLMVGDVFTMAGVTGLHGMLKQFVVRSVCSESGVIEIG